MTDNKETRHSQATLDQSIPYEELLMIFNPEDNPFQETPVLPSGFRFAKPDEIPGLKEQWCQIMQKTGFPFSMEEAAGFFDDMMAQDEDYFVHHLYALLDGKDHLASVVGVWPGNHIGPGYRIHWMMSDPDYQGKGLARAVMAKAIHDYFKENPENSLYLSTQAQSWPAIRMYESLGFSPFEKESSMYSKEENIRRWNDARKTVREKYGLDI